MVEVLEAVREERTADFIAELVVRGRLFVATNSLPHFTGVVTGVLISENEDGEKYVVLQVQFVQHDKELKGAHG